MASDGTKMEVDGVSSTDDDIVQKNNCDDEEESSDDEAEETKIQEISAKLKENPYLYDVHIELIKLLRAAGELDKLRDAREQMASVFPLTGELWLEWVEDEQKYIEGKEQREKVTKLFERAINDYLSVEVWLEYVQFALGDMSVGGLPAVRSLFERALNKCGLHVSKGYLIWDAYREFEMAIMDGLQPALGAIATKEQTSKLEHQTNRVNGLFKRQLSIPLQNMESTYAEYLGFIGGEEQPDIKRLYQQNASQLKILNKFEDDIDNSDPPHLAEYMKYIDYEVEKGEPPRIQCLFERAIVENCLDDTIWLRYVNYLDSTLKLPELSNKVYERAVRNCPWTVKLWHGYVMSLERQKCPHEKIKESFDRAMSGGITSGSDFLTLWTAYCDYMRRRINWDEDHSDALEALRNTFQAAIDHLHSGFPEDADPNYSLHQYWARVEAKFCKNMVKSRDLWNNIMQSGFGSSASAWLEYFNLERAYGDHKHCRKILQRAVNSANDYPESVFEAYINFEREEGTLDQYDIAVERCESQQKRINERRAKAAEKELRKDEKKGGKQPRKQFKQKVTELEDENFEHIMETTKAKSTQNKVPDKQQDIGFKVPISPASKKGIKQAPTGSKRHAGAGEPLKAGEPAAKKYKDAAFDNGDDEPSESKIINAETQEEMAALDFDSSVFLSNLSFKIKEEKILNIFRNRKIEIEELRLVKDLNGKPKGFAYVQLKNKTDVTEALKMDRIPVEGRPMYVSKCEDKSKNPTQFKYSIGMEKCKLFIKGLPFTMDKDALKKLFEQHGIIKDLRLVTRKNGASKGLAYVEYIDEATASKAVLKTDGLVVGDKTISVAISNPPARKPQGSLADKPSFTPSLGGGKRDVEGRGKARTQIFMPRSMQKSATVPKPKPSAAKSVDNVKTSSTSDSSHSSGSDESDLSKPKKLSNADFRQLLLKK